MRLSPLRRTLVLVPLMLVACKEQPANPTATSKPEAAPTIAAGERSEPLPGLGDQKIAAFRAKAVSPDDFVINFGEPFIGLETRGGAVLVEDFTAGQRFAYIATIERSGSATEPVIAMDMQSPWGDPNQNRWRVLLEKRQCDDEFSGEITDYIAWSESKGRSYRLRGCARIAGSERRGRGGWRP